MTTITIDRALLEQALDALNCCYSEKYDGAKFHGAKAALRAALASQPANLLDKALEAPKAMAQAYENGYNAALANGPAWRNAPTVSGLWIARQANGGHEVRSLATTDTHGWPSNARRWFGPIPEDKK